MGENGAGKSTVMRIAYGFYTADEGEILVNGEVRDLVKERRGTRLTGPETDLFTGEYWTGRTAVELGLADDRTGFAVVRTRSGVRAHGQVAVLAVRATGRLAIRAVLRQVDRGERVAEGLRRGRTTARTTIFATKRVVAAADPALAANGQRFGVGHHRQARKAHLVQRAGRNAIGRFRGRYGHANQRGDKRRQE